MRQDIILKPERKTKKTYPSERIINWYLGNYLNSPNNAIREDPFKKGLQKNWKPKKFDEIESIRNELKGKLIAHSDFLKLVKEKGIHDKYYHYKKYENNCEICRAIGAR
jgi:hypothetical protein